MHLAWESTRVLDQTRVDAWTGSSYSVNQHESRRHIKHQNDLNKNQGQDYAKKCFQWQRFAVFAWAA